MEQKAIMFLALGKGSLDLLATGSAVWAAGLAIAVGIGIGGYLLIKNEMKNKNKQC